jgi:hypothetical protein
MKTPHGLLAALGLALVAGGAFAQFSEKVNCISGGGAAPEPLGADGRALSVASATCITEGGAMSGGVATQSGLWELDKGQMLLLSGDGVVRKPGSLLAYKLTSGTLTLQMQDGRPTGWAGSGTGVYTAASGDAAALKGKSFSWTGRATGPRTHVIESRLD